MPEWTSQIGQFFAAEQAHLGRAVLIVVVGLALAVLVRRLGGRTADRLKSQRLIMARRGMSYLVVVVAVAWALHELGFKLGAILGAAGVLTVALGFAAQTSMSNLISGLFLIWERPFVIGDVVTVENITGEVLGIDLLSVRLRTFDNLQVRIPNETLIKSNVTTLTSFPIRRYDALLSVAYEADLDRVREVLFEVADDNPLCLEEPAPLFLLLGFGDAGVSLQFSVWTRQENWIELRNTLLGQIKKAFDAAGIELPYPHRSLLTAGGGGAFPIRIVEPDPRGPTRVD